MVKHHRQKSYLYYAPPYTIPFHGTVPTQLVAVDTHWFHSWPSIRSIILSITIIISSTAIISLDIANIAIERNKRNGTSTLGTGTANVGAGIWSGSISFIAAIFIVMTISMRNKRAAATFALLAVTLAFLFTIVLIGLIGNAVQINRSKAILSDSEKTQDKLMIAILSAALFTMILCTIFFIMYIKVFFSSSTRQSTIQ